MLKLLLPALAVFAFIEPLLVALDVIAFAAAFLSWVLELSARLLR